MKYTATQANNEQVSNFWRTMIDSEVGVDRPLTEKDCLVLMLASAFDGSRRITRQDCNN